MLGLKPEKCLVPAAAPEQVAFEEVVQALRYSGQNCGSGKSRQNTHSKEADHC